MLARFAELIWYKAKPLAIVFLPLSAIFFLLSKMDKKQQLKKQQDFAVPVVVVGNINIGGTGKTPVVIALVNYLKAQGLKPAVVSRGFGGAATYPYALNEHTTADVSGDEPLLIYQQCQCPVVVSPLRNEAIQMVLDDHDVDVVISDDGLQHYRMARDIEIVVIDSKRGLGNRWCLPAGPLRELSSRLKTVDFVIANGAEITEIECKQVVMQLQPVGLKALANTTTEEPKAGSEVYAVAGIGNPERFFQTLQGLGYKVIKKPFADHYRYSEADVLFDDNKPVLMTSKDAVKCVAFNALDHHWQLPVEASFSDEFLPQLQALIEQKRQQKKSKRL